MEDKYTNMKKAILIIILATAILIAVLVTIVNLGSYEKEEPKSHLEKVTDFLIEEEKTKVRPSEPEPEDILEEIIEEPVVLTFEEEVDGYVKEIGSLYDIDPYLIHSIIWHESRYNPDTATGNCLGLMQVCTTYHMDRAARLGVIDFFDPYGSILLGVDYISELINKYGTDMKLILMLYNMDHDSAFNLYNKGELSSYARSVLDRAAMLKEGVN